VEIRLDYIHDFVTDAEIYVDWLKEEVSDEIIEESLGVITTYLTVPEPIKVNSHIAIPLAELAKHLFLYITPLGRWQEISTLWPQVLSTIEYSDNPTLKLTVRVKEEGVYKK